ncbi:electron transfer flavoprotein subunit alpha/FixB family protein [Dongia sp.]|uniref:electron transfer flavoprotein subunit alpha/FixB family protein n=1 Tax=Dongia sp. TaxID=1977262 RepID=UPI0035B4667A
MKVLVYIDLLDGKPTAIARELANGAKQLAGSDGTVELAYFGQDANAVKDLGANKILLGPGAGPIYNPTIHGAYLDAAIDQSKPDLVLLGYTTSGLDLGPVVAMRRNLPVLSYCTAVRVADGRVEVDSQIYGGKLISTAQAALPSILLVNAGAFREADGTPNQSADIVELPPITSSANVEFVSATQPDPNAVDITKAARLLCVGRGIGDEDSIEEAREVAGLLSGELVGSRPIIDAGWLPKERQVGKSGRKVKPKLYLALGVSGAPEHIEGMGSADVIVAINTDAKAPIFDHAHIGANVDIADFLPAFKEAISKKVS